MTVMDKFQQTLEKTLIPFSNKLGQNKIMQSISAGMIMTLPVTIGASVFSILANFPIKAVSEWFQKVGISQSMTAIVNGSTNILAVFIAFSIAYSYAKRSNANPNIAGLLSLASFFMLAPQSVQNSEEAINAFAMNYLGSEGIIVAILIAIIVSVVYVKLSNIDRLKIKLPESVPSMVSSSLEPLWIGIILFFGVFVVRAVVDYTSYGTIFEFINKMVAAPLMNIGGSVPVILLVFVLSNVLFLFGIHPAAIQAAIMPIIISMMVSNAPAFQAGERIPNLENLAVFGFVNNDAAGATLSLLIVGLLFGKSKRYKEFFKITLIPNIFNVNEPVIFGMPIVFNPIMFIPFSLSSLVTGGIAWLAVKIGFITNYNPMIGLGMPWTLPKVISSAFTVGWQGPIIWIINFILMALIYLPFFKVLDLQALKEEESVQNEFNETVTQ